MNNSVLSEAWYTAATVVICGGFLAWLMGAGIMALIAPVAAMVISRNVFDKIDATGRPL